MSFLKLTDQNVNGKTVLIRADLNVPFKDGKISDDTRIRASLPSIQYCLDNGAAVIVMTHLGRPTEGEFHPEDDVAPVAAHLGALLGKEVKVLNDWRDNPPSVWGKTTKLAKLVDEHPHRLGHLLYRIHRIRNRRRCGGVGFFYAPYFTGHIPIDGCRGYAIARVQGGHMHE